MTIGNVIRIAREQAGKTQSEIAAAVGTSQLQIGKYERGLQDMTFRRFLAIAEAIGIDPCVLIKNLKQFLKIA